MTTCSLNLYNLELKAHLGVPDFERAELQSVWIDLQIKNTHLPEGCYTDQIEDTLCYAGLCNLIEKIIAHRPFHLIESLSYTLYHEIEKTLPPQAKLALKLRKNPPIRNLSLSEFCIGEWS